MKHCLHRLALAALCAAGLLSIAHAQGRVGIAFEFDSTARFNAEAGQTLQLALRACDERQGTVENWDSIGKDVTLTVRGSLAETDTSTRSWNGRSRAFTWVHVKAGDIVLPLDSIRLVDAEPLLFYTIPRSVFVQGHATLFYSQSRADSGIVLSISPRWGFLRQDSPPLGFLPGPIENFLLEITSQTANASEVFLLRRYEVVVTPRDRYLNPQHDSTASVLFSARFLNEFDQNQPAIDDVFGGAFDVQGPTPFMLASRIARPDTTYGNNPERQWIAVHSVADSTIRGQSDEYAVLHHAPNPVSLLSPADETYMRLRRSTNEEVFSWEIAQPKDPYHNIRISRFDSVATNSDEVRYSICIVDAISLTRVHQYESDNHGSEPRWTARHYDLNAVIIQQSGLPTTRRWNVIWYVEATDGLYVTLSLPLSETQIGLRMTLDRYEYFEVPVETLPDSPDFTLHPNYPNPFNPGTVIPVELQASGNCRLQVLDLMGKEVAVLHDGFLEAGSHRFGFDARDLPSGVYSYRVILDGVTRTRPMLLLR
ncbi:MAG: T9SS type A sorting domain-containing protein [Bacteroidetes bacterium]|nr:T9SS type A sorting domain-containing protein [Bacteroidota bacterium]